MSRGQERYIDMVDGTKMFIGEDFVCDLCGHTESCNHGMESKEDTDKHVCISCVGELTVKYFEQTDRIAPNAFTHDFQGKRYKIKCFSPTKRFQITKKVRKKVLSTGKCEGCGSTENIEVDHIFPVSKGGTNNIKNLQPLCRPCNLKKGNKTILQKGENAERVYKTV